ncbi:restriction endonuclease [Streptomyces sp. NPDC003077]|uniref:restriction endonuclease n=1 Tax=Streptomyces sp. NPDC003077 TaxID=3154443 RepID=UPI0033AE6ABD
MTRRPVRRSSRRRRKQSAGGPLVLVALLGLGALAALIQWLVLHWWVLIVIGVLGVLVGSAWLHGHRQRLRWARARAAALRYTLEQLDALHYDQFEYAVRDLMIRDGCTAEKRGGRGDNGCDVFGTDPSGRRWVLQCKHRRRGLAGSAVGVPDLQVLNGTARQFHRADVVVLVTNGRVTSTAVPWARSQRIHLVDRELLGQWAAGSRPLWELLRQLPPPRRAVS